MIVISQLSDTASRLNRESDSINSTIQDIQDRINELNLGLEVWLEDSPLILEDGPPALGRTFRNGLWLGYTKIGDKWALAVRWVRIEDKVNEIGEEYSKVTNRNEPIPLLKFSREVRIEALSHIEQLVIALKERADRALNAISEAKKIARIL